MRSARREATWERVSQDVHLPATLAEVDVLRFEEPWTALEVFADGGGDANAVGVVINVYAMNEIGTSALLFTGTLTSATQNAVIHGVGGKASAYRVTAKAVGTAPTKLLRVAALAYGSEPS